MKKTDVGLRRFGIEIVGNVPWGTHLCQFYQTKEDLKDILVPYFAEGLRNNEYCMWITSLPLKVKEAKEALEKVVPDLDSYLEKGQIEILPHTEWYVIGGEFDADKVLDGWVQKEKSAISRGFAGLRLSGNTFWIERKKWKSFVDYEAKINEVIGLHKMIALCTYSLQRCIGTDVVDVVRNHVGTLIRKGETWYLVEDVAQRKRIENELVQSTRAQRKMEDELKSLARFPFENPHAVLRTDSSGIVSYCNPECQRSLREVISEAGQRVPDRWRQYIKDALSSNNRLEFEEHIDGRTYSLEMVPVSSENYVNVYGVDITERKLAEQALRDSEERFRVITQTSPVQISVSRGSDGTILFTNPAYDRAFGFAEGELVGQKAPNLYWDPTDRVRLIDALKARGFLQNFEAKVKRIDGTSFWISASVRNVNFAGEPAILGTSIDITERKEAEERLKDNEALLRSFFESPGAMRGIVETVNDADIRHIRDNEITATYIGLTPEDLRGRLSSELGEPTERMQVWLEQYKRSQISGQPVRFEYLDKHGSGESWLAATVTYLGTASSGHPRFAYVVLDVTERKKTEDAIRRLNERLELAQRAAGVGVWDWDLRTGRMEWTSEMFRLLGLDPETDTASFESWNAALHGEDREKAAGMIDQALKTHSPLHDEYRVVRPDGKTVWINALGQGEYDIQNQPTRMRGICIDITERKQMESKLEDYSDNLEKLVEERTKKLELSSLYARSLIEASLDPLVTISAEGKITDVNSATESATGHSRERMIGSDFSDYFTEPEKARMGYRKVFAEGFVRDYPLAIRHTSGKTTYVLYNASVFRNVQGEIQGVFAAARDITELKKAEEQAQESARKLKDAERLAAIGATAGMIGHDIRNPLQSIVGNVDLLNMSLESIPESVEKDDMQESLKDMEKQADYINKIIMDLQDFTKPLKPILEEIDLQIIVDDLLHNLQIPSNIKAQIHIDGNARKLTSDAAHVKRVLGNLILNAVQAMAEGGSLTIHAYEESEGIVVTVEDTGLGIPEAYREKLFQPLFTTKSKGQGFGLAVAKRLTEALNGTITYESQEGKGTRFMIRLPHRNSELSLK